MPVGSGHKNHRWKGGTYVNKSDKGPLTYVRMCAGPQRGRYVHDLIMEAVLQRPLLPDETVEHKDGNYLNLAWDNLIVVTRAENTRLMHERIKRDAQAEAKQSCP